MEKGQLIGQGRTAEVYEWGNDKVLKLYLDWFNKDWITYENNVFRAVNESGVPSPAVYETVEIDGRTGVIFQRIAGKSLFKIIEAKPWAVSSVAKAMATLHYKIHSYKSEKLPTQKDKLTYAIAASKERLGDKTERILEYLSNMPQANSVCHYDFHPDNILVTDDGYVTIDWTNSYSGDPLSDVARTCLILRSPYMIPGAPWYLIAASRIIKAKLHSVYLREYMRLSKADRKDIESWMLPLAAARLLEKVPGEEKWLLEIIDKKL